jgi:hypothetical protein
MTEDRALANVTADLDAYVLLERAFCRCDPDAGLCLCGWEDR